MIISNETMDFNDPKELDNPQLFDDPQIFDDPQLYDDQLEVWTLIIQKSTVIPPSLMVLFFNKILTDSADSGRMVRIKNKISSKFGVFLVQMD